MHLGWFRAGNLVRTIKMCADPVPSRSKKGMRSLNGRSRMVHEGDILLGMGTFRQCFYVRRFIPAVTRVWWVLARDRYSW
jgi:hypothetical protein